MAESRTVDFFLGANTPQGFYSYFSLFDEPVPGFRRYLIKGGPGTGKSNLMKRISSEAEKEDAFDIVERIHCSSDVHSLDGVVWHARKCAIFDATPPHAVEPKYPGAYDRMVSITECWDNDKLAKCLPEIVEVSGKISALHKRCQVLLAAADMLYAQNALALAGLWQESKLERSGERFAKRLLYGASPAGVRQAGQKGKETYRMLSAVTNQGVVTYVQTIAALAERVVCIRDPYGTVSEVYLNAVRERAKKQGLPMILCMSALHPGKLDHIILPEQRIAVVTEDTFQSFKKLGQTQMIRVLRYLPPKEYKAIKESLRHRQKIMTAVIADAIECLKQAKTLHDRLEGYYTPAVDFEKVDRLTRQVIAEMTDKRAL